MKRKTKIGSLFVAVALTCCTAACGTGGCGLDIDLTPKPSFDVSAQSYDNDEVTVFARIDLSDNGPHQFRATIGGHDEILTAKDGSLSMSATFPAIATSYTAEVRDNDTLLATIDVPAAFVVGDVPVRVTQDSPQLAVTVSPPPAHGVAVSIRVRPGGCLPVVDDSLGSNVYPATSVSDTFVAFDATRAFTAMTADECDQPLGIRYASLGTSTDHRVTTASGLREEGITVHLVRGSTPIIAPDASIPDAGTFDAGDASDAADASDGSSD